MNGLTVKTSQKHSPIESAKGFLRCDCTISILIMRSLSGVLLQLALLNGMRPGFEITPSEEIDFGRSHRSAQSSSRDLRGLKERRRVLGRLIVVVSSVFSPSSCVLGIGKRGGCVIRHMQISQVYPVDGDFSGRLRAVLSHQARSISGCDSSLPAETALVSRLAQPTRCIEQGCWF